MELGSKYRPCGFSSLQTRCPPLVKQHKRCNKARTKPWPIINMITRRVRHCSPPSRTMGGPRQTKSGLLSLGQLWAANTVQAVPNFKTPNAYEKPFQLVDHVGSQSPFFVPFHKHSSPPTPLLHLALHSPTHPPTNRRAAGKPVPIKYLNVWKSSLWIN